MLESARQQLYCETGACGKDLAGTDDIGAYNTVLNAFYVVEEIQSCTEYHHSITTKCDLGSLGD